MVLFAIDKDILPTSIDYVLSKNKIFRGRATVTIGGNTIGIDIVNVKVTKIDATNVYAKIRIEGIFAVPSDFTLNAIELGGYLSYVSETQKSPLTAVSLGGMAARLPRGGYYVSVTVTLQSPANFDFFVS